MNRREFISASMMTGCGALLGGCRALRESAASAARVPYGDSIGDRLWMWGHHPRSFASLKGTVENYNLPYDRRIDMADACRAMDIPGCFVVRWTNNPRKEELNEYMKQFRSLKRIGFSITDSAVESFDEKVRLGLELADKMPNLTTLVMDDFYSGAAKAVTLDKIRALKPEIKKRGMKLSIVLYSDQNGIKQDYKEVLDLCDEVTLWFWHGKNTSGIVERVDALRALIGNEKPVLLGQYMYDFGGKKPLSGDAMQRQLTQTSELLARKAVDGVIFHCTPLVDLDLEAVRASKKWIAAHAGLRWGQEVK